MAWTKAKTVIVVGIGVLLAAGTTTVAVKEIQKHNDDRWDTVRRFDSQVLDKAPHIVRIIPTKFPNRHGWAGNNGRQLAIGASLSSIVEVAYGGFSFSSRTVFLTTLPSKKYDFISNLPSGSMEALQQELKRQFGVVARTEMIETNVLVLTVKFPDAQSLIPTRTLNDSSESHSSERTGLNQFSCVNQPLSILAEYLEGEFGTSVVAQDGLTQSFDINLKWHGNDPQHDSLKQALLDQLGLELVPGQEPIEMLVVEKADN